MKTPFLPVPPFGHGVWLAFDQKQVDAVIRRWKDDKEEMPKVAATITSGNETLVMVNLDRPPDLASLVGIIAHEATHVGQHIMQRVGESKEAVETPAYIAQMVAEWAFGILQPRYKT